MALIVYNKENSRPQEVLYKGKRTINLDSRGTVYLSKTMSIELGVLGGGRVSFAHDDDTETGISAVPPMMTGSSYGRTKGARDSPPDSLCTGSCSRRRWSGKAYSS